MRVRWVGVPVRYIARLQVRKRHRMSDLIKGLFRMTNDRLMVREMLRVRREWAARVLQRNLPVMAARGILARARRAAIKIQSIFRCGSPTVASLPL